MNNLLLLPFTNFNYITFVRGIKTFLGMGSPLERAYSWAAKSFASVKRVPSTYRASQNGMGKSTSLLKPDCRARHWDYVKQAKRNSQNASVLKCIELYLQSLFILIPPSFQKDILRKPHGPSYELHRFNWDIKVKRILATFSMFYFLVFFLAVRHPNGPSTLMIYTIWFCLSLNQWCHSNVSKIRKRIFTVVTFTNQCI